MNRFYTINKLYELLELVFDDEKDIIQQMINKRISSFSDLKAMFNINAKELVKVSANRHNQNKILNIKDYCKQSLTEKYNANPDICPFFSKIPDDDVRWGRLKPLRAKDYTYWWGILFEKEEKEGYNFRENNRDFFDDWHDCNQMDEYEIIRQYLFDNTDKSIKDDVLECFDTHLSFILIEKLEPLYIKFKEITLQLF